MSTEPRQKVVFAIPILGRPYPQCIKALEDSLPLVEAAGFDHAYVQEIDCPYISGARATMLRKALDAQADIIVFIDYDVSWRPEDMVKLLQTKGDVVAGTYRIKHQDMEKMDYMSTFCTSPDGRPIVRTDGAIKAKLVPAGFLKITKEAVASFMYHYPELTYGPLYNQSVDIFNHGAVLGDRIWWGEDYCFSWRWNEKCGDIWLVPDMNISHWSRRQNPDTHQMEYTEYPGNIHEYLLRLPGGGKSDNPLPQIKLVA